MGTGQATTAELAKTDALQYLLQCYDKRIAYYWKASQSNKNAYKVTRYLLILLGAAVTLISSMASADFIKTSGALSMSFAILTPLLAASMAIVGGFSQAFQWGAAWSEMVIIATRLETERDRIAVTPKAEVNPTEELALLNDLVLNETRGFFQRLFGAGGPAKSESKPS